MLDVRGGELMENTMRLFVAREAVCQIANDILIPPAFAIAMTQLGQREVAGAGCNPHIADYFTATSYHATSDEVAWCSAFACWCVESAGIRSPRSAAALDWLKWRVPHTLTKPYRGCVMVYERPEGGSYAGHVGFFSHRTTAGDWVLGGNQGNEVSIALQTRQPVAIIGWGSEGKS
jgi:uncharacterized protein (TIGR02594 family)